MKKKLKLDEMAESINELSASMNNLFFVGGEEPSTTCWWQCLAYFLTKGKDYSKEKAEEYARQYWGDRFNSEFYALFGKKEVFYNCAYNFTKDLIRGKDFMEGTIIIFPTPYKYVVEGVEYTQMHAVVMTGFDGNNYTYIDPSSDHPEEEHVRPNSTDIITIKIGRGGYASCYY